MSVDRQRNLFAMPKTVGIDFNHPQRAVLDWAAFNDGRFAVFPGKLSKQSLRTLIAKGLIRRMGQPPRYTLTGIGWAVRGRGHGTRGERYSQPPLMASLFQDNSEE
jgi:hypothetical protein